MNETVLIIEDDKTIQKFLNISLKTKGYNIIGVETGMEGLSAFMMEKPNIILLDLGLPDTDGIEILQDIRRQSDIPIIIISARDQEKEKILALDAGADDYVVKPFGPGELMARIRVALRNKNSSSQAESVFELDYLKVDFDKRKVYIDGNEIHLTPLEYKMLSLLIKYKGKVLTHKFIQQNVWGCETTDEYQGLRVFMANIRRKLNDNSSNPRFIITEMGVGYRFVDE
ncbi:MAG: response regulator [Firmicutes bacterium]|nr:response regulator [Bacillota bacterium]MBR0104192.1 response regulator [Bacillota bacterium]MBR2593309.1 response regulator [Bacillota bacterium]